MRILTTPTTSSSPASSLAGLGREYSQVLASVARYLRELLAPSLAILGPLQSGGANLKQGVSQRSVVLYRQAETSLFDAMMANLVKGDIQMP